MCIFQTCCPLDSDGVSSSGRPPRSCAVAWAEPPADEGREPLPLESRVSPSELLAFGCNNIYIFILLFISILFVKKKKSWIQCYISFARNTVLYSERFLHLLSPLRITPRKFDTVPSDDPQSSASPTHLTLTKRGTRTSFTFRRIRREPCRCGEIPHSLRHSASSDFLTSPSATLCLSSLSLGL